MERSTKLSRFGELNIPNVETEVCAEGLWPGHRGTGGSPKGYCLGEHYREQVELAKLSRSKSEPISRTNT